MSRSMKKYSSGFHEGNENSMKIRKKNATNGESSSNSSDYYYHKNGLNYQQQTPPPAPSLSPYNKRTYDDEVVEINSDSEEDISHDNNNEEALPDRHRMQESIETEKREDSNSSDVIFVGDSTEEIEKLSWITSDVQLDPADKVCAADFKILKLLGTGAYGRVYLVKKLKGLDAGHLYAMKVLEKVKVMQKKKTTEHTRTEREVLEKIIDCPFLAKMYYAFQTPEKLYLVLGFEQGGELFTHLYKSEHFTEAQVRFYIAEIIVALEQLHKLQVIYRDIKLENILLDAGGHIVITDFGLSKELKDGARTHSFCGTIEYMAPEIVSQCREGHDLNVDWWSVGVLMIELLTGQSPFSRDGEESNQSQISERIQNEPPNIPETIAKPAKDLIEKLLEKTPSRRLGYRNDAEDLKVHEFFKLINWSELKKKHYSAPIVPHLRNGEDVSQFAEDFTKQEPEDLPAEKPTQPNAANYFRGYSFVAPKFRRKRAEETITTPLRLEPERPDLAKVMQCQKLGKGKFFEKYEIEKEDPIGDGTYSICMRCVLKETNQQYAVKIMNPLHDASQEIAALEECQGHNNIVEVIENLEDENFKYIVFELLRGGELFQRIRHYNHFTESLARKHFRQLVRAVNHMHARNIVHRDLKPENIMFVDENEDSMLKIVDFGFARRRTSEETPPCFTLDYAAPESLMKGTTKESRDLWSLGVILYTMLCGNTPFMPKNVDKQHDEKNYRQKLTENIKRGAFNTECLNWENLSFSAKDLIDKLLQVNENDRLTLRKVEEHSWMLQEDELEPIIVEDDDEEIPVTVENKSREENCSNDSSGIVLSERNGGSSLSSHEDVATLQPVQDLEKSPEIENVVENVFEEPLQIYENESVHPQIIKTKSAKKKSGRKTVNKPKTVRQPRGKREKLQKEVNTSSSTSNEPHRAINDSDESGFQGFPASTSDAELLSSLICWRIMLDKNEDTQDKIHRDLRPRTTNNVHTERKRKLPSKDPPKSVVVNESVFMITELAELPKPKRGRPPKNVPNPVQNKNKVIQKPSRGKKRKAEEMSPKVARKPAKQRRNEVDLNTVPISRYPKRQRNEFIVKQEPVQKKSVISQSFISMFDIKREKFTAATVKTIYQYSNNVTLNLKNEERPSMIQERRCYL